MTDSTAKAVTDKKVEWGGWSCPWCHQGTATDSQLKTHISEMHMSDAQDVHTGEEDDFATETLGLYCVNCGSTKMSSTPPQTTGEQIKKFVDKMESLTPELQKKISDNLFSLFDDADGEGASEVRANVDASRTQAKGVSIDSELDEIVQRMLIYYTAWVNGEPVAWNVRKDEAKARINALIAQAVEERLMGLLQKVEDRLLDESIALENEETAVLWYQVQTVLEELRTSAKRKETK